MTETPQTPEGRIAALVHDALGTEPSWIGVEVMDDRVHVTVPVRSYPISGISLLARRTGRKYEVSETTATGTIDFMDNLERAERGQHSAIVILPIVACHVVERLDQRSRYTWRIVRPGYGCCYPHTTRHPTA